MDLNSFLRKVMSLPGYREVLSKIDLIDQNTLIHPWARHPSLVKVEPGDDRHVLLLSEGKRRLWFIHPGEGSMEIARVRPSLVLGRMVLVLGDYMPGG